MAGWGRWKRAWVEAGGGRSARVRVLHSPPRLVPWIRPGFPGAVGQNPPMLRWLLGVPALLFVLGLLALAALAWISRRAQPEGLRTGWLAPCPSKPNCVSSREAGSSGVEPLRVEDLDARAFALLVSLLEADPSMRIRTREERYLHAEAKSSFFGFVDDLEALWVEEEGVIHVRSAARVGHSDLGANARRVEGLRGRWLEAVRADRAR